MLRIRLFESEAVHAIADGLVPGFIHPSIGQEAVPVGVCAHLAKDDLLLSTHRGHGHTLAKGADPEAMMRELFGREGGTCRGKGGSMHIADFSIGMLGANGVVATNITIAAGAAHALKLRGKNAVVACFFGDGATNRGPFLEGLNWAKAFDLPVLFICEDNQWSATTKTSTVLSGPGPLARAQSLGLAGTSINGNDILAVDEAAGAAICAIKSGSGPYFLHCRTYRHGGHTGTDPAAYRNPDEAAKGIEGDPLPACAERLRNANVDEANITAIEEEAAAEMRRIRESAARAPWPDRSITYEDVQDLGAAEART
jgi:pyruvate dehydrogenase E1 component alpha subunit